MVKIFDHYGLKANKHARLNGAFINLGVNFDPISIGMWGEIIVLAVAMVMKFNREAKRNIRIGMAGHLTKQVSKISLSQNEVHLREIIYIRWEDPYLEFHLKGRAEPIVERMTISFLRGLLPPSTFVQIDESYIVNWRFVKTKHDLCVRLKTKKELPLSNIYKEKLADEFPQS